MVTSLLEDSYFYPPSLLLSYCQLITVLLPYVGLLLCSSSAFLDLHCAFLAFVRPITVIRLPYGGPFTMLLLPLWLTIHSASVLCLALHHVSSPWFAVHCAASVPWLSLCCPSPWFALYCAAASVFMVGPSRSFLYPIVWPFTVLLLPYGWPFAVLLLAYNLPFTVFLYGFALHCSSFALWPTDTSPSFSVVCSSLCFFSALLLAHHGDGKP